MGWKGRASALPFHMGSRRPENVPHSEKVVAINFPSRLRDEYSKINVVELGFDFGDFTTRIIQAGLNVSGVDISLAAIAKISKRHPYVPFALG